MKEAEFYVKLDSENVQCCLCPHNCRIGNGKRGRCRVRENTDGRLFSLVYANIIAEHADPIEKKPLYHFLPGSLSYSISTVGCNFTCLHCQNSEISQIPHSSSLTPGRKTKPGDIVSAALSNGCRSIAFTYTEPTIYFEYACETAMLASEKGLKNIFVSNGYINRKPLEKISPWLHAANIDLKAFTDKFYREVCGGQLQPVLETIRACRDLGIWIEITTLIIPGLNDSQSELTRIADFICSIGQETPWHVTAFHPSYRLAGSSRTPLETVISARETGIKAGLKHVYTGNVIDKSGSTTCCPECFMKLIVRDGFMLEKNIIRDSKCPQCGTVINGLFA